MKRKASVWVDQIMCISVNASVISDQIKDVA